MRKGIAAWIALGIITIVAAIALAVTNDITKQTIAVQAKQAEDRARQLVFPGADTFNEVVVNRSRAVLEAVNEAYQQAYGPQGQAKGDETTVTVTKQRLAGTFDVAVTLLRNGTIKDIAFDDAGQAAAVAKADLVNALIGKKAPLNASEYEDLLGKEYKKVPLNSLYAAQSDGQTVGYVGKTTVQGFGGPIEILAGLDQENKITGINVGGPDFSETAGLGAKSKEPWFAQQYQGKTAPVKVVKKGQDKGPDTVDAITAATISSNVVTAGVNEIAAQIDSLLHPAQATAAAEGTTYTAAEQGYAGPVAVFVTAKDSGEITALTVGDDQFSETPGIGAAAQKKEFTGLYLGKTLPLKEDDIQVISGATYTSKAVFAALNRAWEEKNIVAPANAVEGTTYTAAKSGYGGPVAVFVTVKDSGEITALQVGDDKFNETSGLGALAQKPAFTEQFIGKKPPLTLTDIDAVSGATITSGAVIDAINEAVAKKTVAEGFVSAAPAVQATPEITPQATAAAKETAQAAVAANGKEGTGSAQGYGGPVAIKAVFGEDGTIQSVVIGDDKFVETPGLGAKAQEEPFKSQFVGKKAPLKLADIDAIAGATRTSQAVVDAINQAYESVAGGQNTQAAATVTAVVKETAQATAAVAPAKETVQATAAATPSKEALPSAAPSVTPAASPAVGGKEGTGSAQGYGGPVAVKAMFGEDGTIQSIEIGDDKFAETPGLGAKAKDEAFQGQFAGKKAPLKLADIDAIAGATRTSRAVVDAINQAYESLTAGSKEAMGTAKGFAGPVAVKVVFAADGSIQSIQIGDEQFKETEGAGAKAKLEPFASQFIGKKAPLKLTDIDVITGATWTTKAVIEAINQAYASVQ